MLELLALVVLIVVAATLGSAAIVVAIMPGRIARKRQHPQAAAIAVCGWFGLLTVGILLPLAYIWAFTVPQAKESDTQ